MTKEELQKEVSEWNNVKAHADEQIYSAVMDYINNLPYKEGDKVSTSKANVCWIKSIRPKIYYGDYNGEVEVRIAPAKKDGTRSNREWVLWSSEIDSIKKID